MLLDYEEKIQLLSDDDFFTFFAKMGAEPRWVTSAGKQSIQLLGICHGGESHSAVFDPSTLNVTCFSECGGGMRFHTWVKRVLRIENPQEAKDFIEDWIDDRNIDFSGRVPRGEEFRYVERPFERKSVSVVAPIPGPIIADIRSHWDESLETLARLVWCQDDKINAETLHFFDVGANLERKTIMLPHHNINGDIVGIYERSFLPLRREIKKLHPEAGYKFWVQFPRAKYVPLLKEEKYLSDEDKALRDKGETYKTSWSFPNSFNLYGLHKTAPGIKERKVAIVFEGAKSVMLAWQWDFNNTVATHTFGIHENHVNMLLDAGATEIWLAFDKQYKTTAHEDREWELYQRRTYEFAKKIAAYCDVYRLCDKGKLLDYKDAPVDKGKERFEQMIAEREPLFIGGVDQVALREEQRQEKQHEELVQATATLSRRSEEEILANQPKSSFVGINANGDYVHEGSPLETWGTVPTKKYSNCI